MKEQQHIFPGTGPDRGHRSTSSACTRNSSSKHWVFLLPLGLLISLACGAFARYAPVGVSSSSFDTAWPQGADRESLIAARKTITEEELQRHVAFLSAPELEGRDSPSRGLTRAGDYLVEQLKSYGYSDLAGDGSYRHAFSRVLSAPKADRCFLEVNGGGRSPEDEQGQAVLGQDFVPLPGCSGEAGGQAIFVGFGIDRRGYDDLAKKKLKGKVAVILEGEPRHKRLFEGPEILTDAADIYGKVQALVDEDVAGVLIVRRDPAQATIGPKGEPLAAPTLGYRYTWATWNPTTTERAPRTLRSFRTPVLEITPQLASWILGEDVLRLANRIDESGKPKKSKGDAKRVSLSSGFEKRELAIDNIAGFLQGTDEKLRDEVLVLGAHYDHIGVDPWGRIGFGADDNASGTSAMLEVAQALAETPPRRSLLVVFFSAEEDGLLGSAGFLESPPIPIDQMVAMLNMDMVGRGEEEQVVVLGTRQNPDLARVLKRAQKIKGSGIRNVVTNRAAQLWERSDHFSFHRVGVPVLFFFEGPEESDNEDYHTYRDSADLVDESKVANTARFCLQVAWLLGNADERPGPPR